MRTSLAVHRGPLWWATAVALSAVLVGGVCLVWPSTPRHTVIGYFSSAVGLYSGDEVRIVGVPVGTIDSIEPQTDGVKITMSLDGGIDIPADAHAVLMAPNLVSARFIQLTPAYTGGSTAADGATIGFDRTAVPVEWDEVKTELTQLAAQLGPQPAAVQGPLSTFIDQTADTFDGKGDSFRAALHELSQASGRLGDSRTDIFGIVRNLKTLIDALSASNEQVVQFTSHLAAVSKVLADSSTHLDDTLGTLTNALTDVRGFLHDNKSALIGQVDKVTDLTNVLSDQSDDIEQILHVAPNAIANFYNIYNPAQGTLSGLLAVPNFTNPVQFICGTFDAGASPDAYKRAEICRQRMAPVLKRLTANYPPVLFHPLNGITAYKGQVIYDTPATQAKAQTPINELHWVPASGAPAGKPPDDLSSLLLPPTPGGG
jgi:phospholipid/cholesterol/gamma-HCH transport system substrate-binding protein